MPFWNKVIIPKIKLGQKILISASGNSLRAIVKKLNNISEEDIINFNIPYGVPMVYELDKNFQVIKWYYLGDPKKIKKITEEIKNQGKAK
jgi:2,3-bisphosphoglycerate-dependent phosphoglycerate mutase